MNSRLGADHGPAVARRRSSRRSRPTRRCPHDPFAPNGYFGLQQIRWPPTNIADTPEEALARLFMLPGAHYSDPELSWKFEVAPGGIGFLDSRGLGAAVPRRPVHGRRARLPRGRPPVPLRADAQPPGRSPCDDPRLEDRVADNLHKWEITESESLLFGRNFGVGTDIQTGPNGNLYVVSLDHGAIYEIHARRSEARRRLAHLLDDQLVLDAG